MNISEANALNRVLDWLADIEASDRTDGEVLGHLHFLAERANKALGAGHTGAAVVDLVWPKVLEHREQARRARSGLLDAQESDGAAQAVCRGIEAHLAHNGSLPWPSISRPYEEWQAIRTAQAEARGGED